MKRHWYLIDSCIVALLLASGLAIYLKKNKQVVHAFQSLSADGTWSVYTTVHGLPSDQVTRVVVDNTGQVWAGFQKGDLSNPYNEIISRLDGDTWVNYFLPGCTVEPLVAANTVYAGTHCPGPHSNQGYGLHWFVDDTWVNFTPSDGMQGTYISAIAPEGESKVWFSAGYTNVCYSYVNLLSHKGTADKSDDEWTIYDFSAAWGLCSVYGIGIDPDGNHWFGTNGGMWVLTVDNTWIMHYENDGDDFAFDHQGNVWASYSDYITMFDGVSWVSYLSQEEAIEANYEAVMNTLNRRWVQGVYDGLWVVEEPAGVWVKNNFEDVRFFNGQNWIAYNASNSSFYGYSIQGMALDRNGNVWVASDIGVSGSGGLYKFTPEPDYKLEAAPEAIFLEQGGETAVNIDVTRLRGWVPTATLTVTGLHPSVSAVFNTNPVSPTERVQLTLTSAPSTPISIYEFDIEATASDGLVRSDTLTLHIVEELFQSFFPGIFKA